MNHIRRGPPGRGPSEPALPGASLPRYAFEDEDVDDAADTTERAPVSAAAARRIVRRRPSRADATDEVEVTDILLEAYLEAPPPPRPRPRSDEEAAVDALLSDVARAEETPSLGPMLVSRPPVWPSTAPTAFRPEPPPSAPAPGPGALAGLGLVLVAVGAMLGAGAVLRFRDAEPAARSARATAAPRALGAAAHALPARAPTLAPPAIPATPAVAVTALPAPLVPPDRARLLLPETARGHRVFYDGALVGEGARDVLVRCGKKKHTLRIGSAGAPREIEPPCGGELDLR